MSTKDKAQALKLQGNEAYKKKDFDAASKLFEEAILADPTEITFYTNLAAVYFETKVSSNKRVSKLSICKLDLLILIKDFQKCVETCARAIDIGRENRADFKLIAKALARMGKAYQKNGDLYNAKSAFEKALTEHRLFIILALFVSFSSWWFSSRKINTIKKNQNWNNSKTFLRTPEYRTNLSDIESQIKKKEAEDYINPEVAEKV